MDAESGYVCVKVRRGRQSRGGIQKGFYHLAEGAEKQEVTNYGLASEL
jgi:hypothetical protein